MIYESQCSKCGKSYEYSASVADMKKKLPKCCGKKTARVILTPPALDVWPSWQSIRLDGKYIDTGSAYKKAIKEGGYMSVSEGNAESKNVKRDNREAQKKKLRKAIDKAMRAA